MCVCAKKKVGGGFQKWPKGLVTEKMSHLNRKRAFNFAPNELPDKKNGATKKTSPPPPSECQT